MEHENRIVFDPFYLDLANHCLWQDSQATKLRPKAFELLNYLLGHPGQLVTKEELLDAVWPETFVGEAVLKVTIRQIRAALDDDPKSPRFIETAHRRGYRFIAQITDTEHIDPKTEEIRGHKINSAALARTLYFPLEVVGRDKPLSLMKSRLERARSGERQIIFVTGEAGIGKTALVDTFTRSIAFDGNVRVCRGQGLEQYGTSEAYLPVLEAMGRLCRQDPQIINVLRTHAPIWLLQMPSLISAADRELLSREVLGATRERMLREISEALDALTEDLTLVLILEDLHWSDYSTLDLISYLARQRHSSRLLLIGTYRSAELIVSGHPLKAVKQELLARQQCEELQLDYLTETEVAEYLSVRFPGNQFPAELAGLIHSRTEGNPLFMVNAIDYLEAERLIVESEHSWQLAVAIEKVEVGVPDSIRQMIEKQLELLNPEQQRTLEAASVAGAEFPSLAVAAGLEEDRKTVEERCDELARQHQFIQDFGIRELPNGQTVTQYGFIHALYQNALYERISASRRIQLHRRIGERGEALYGERGREIAAELAMHFEHGANYRKAVKYLQQAAENEILRFAYAEAVSLARRGLELLDRLPDSPERAQQELSLQLTLGVPLIATEGYAAPNVGNVYTRARSLCQQLGETPEIAQVLWGLRTFYTVRGELGTASQIADEFLRLAERVPYPGLVMRGHWAKEITFLHLGEFSLAIEHFERALLRYDPERHRHDSFQYAQNPAVAMRCFASWALWFLGKPDEALTRIDEAVTLARTSSEPNSLAPAYFFAAILYQLRREDRMAQEYAEEALAVSAEHGLVLYQALATTARGWALFSQGRRDEGIGLMKHGLAAHEATGAKVVYPHFLALLAESLGKTREEKEGLRLVEEALTLADRNNERYYQAELLRVKGELILLKASDPGLSRAATGNGFLFDANRKEAAVGTANGIASLRSYGEFFTEPSVQAAIEAEACFYESLRIAQQQSAKSLELRTAMSIARFYQSRNKRQQARCILGPIYESFSEGFGTPDLREAKALLQELS
ncbi:MAG TPA: AAA family ATPase [Blastocatellia bacterium]|nr:AAA family ATPase [Blastocatellia bacterium]